MDDAWLIFTDMDADGVAAIFMWVHWRAHHGCHNAGHVLFVTNEGNPRVKAARLTKLLYTLPMEKACATWQVLSGTGSHASFPLEENRVHMTEIDLYAPLMAQRVRDDMITKFLITHPSCHIVAMCPPRDLMRIVMHQMVGRVQPVCTVQAHLTMTGGANIASLMTEGKALTPDDIDEFLQAFQCVRLVDPQCALGSNPITQLEQLPSALCDEILLWNFHLHHTLLAEFECLHLPTVKDIDMRMQARSLWMDRSCHIKQLAELPCFAESFNPTAAKCLQLVSTIVKSDADNKLVISDNTFDVVDVLTMSLALQPDLYSMVRATITWRGTQVHVMECSLDAQRGTGIWSLGVSTGDCTAHDENKCKASLMLINSLTPVNSTLADASNTCTL